MAYIRTLWVGGEPKYIRVVNGRPIRTIPVKNGDVRKAMWTAAQAWAEYSEADLQQTVDAYQRELKFLHRQMASRANGTVEK